MQQKHIIKHLDSFMEALLSKTHVTIFPLQRWWVWLADCEWGFFCGGESCFLYILPLPMSAFMH